MSEHWISLADIPADGREFSFSDQDIWLDPGKEFGIDFTVKTPLEAAITVYPQKEGCLVTGKLQGKISLPCDRCLAETDFALESEFDVFEPYEPEKDDRSEPELLRPAGESYELNAGALLWEQFLLALPTKPLCREECSGVCPKCGLNLNRQECRCEGEEGDPRLEILRKLKVSKDD